MEEKTDEVCPKCGKPMVIKQGRFGKFIPLRLPGMQDRQTSQKPSQRNRDEMPQMRRDLARRPRRNSDEEN